MCGIAGLVLGARADSAAPELLETALSLQHRGQEAAGIACASGQGPTRLKKGLGLVLDVFGDDDSLDGLSGSMGICHVRYSTTPTSLPDETQPFHAVGLEGLTFAHVCSNIPLHSIPINHPQNGQILNAHTLCEELEETLYPVISSPSSSEALLALLARSIRQTRQNHAPRPLSTLSTLRPALETIYSHCLGSYACVAMLSDSPGDSGIITFRDASGLKPLVWGRRELHPGQTDYMCASESIALDRLGFDHITDVLPGQAIFFPSPPTTTPPTVMQIVPPRSYTPDLVEFLSFAHPDSSMDGINVHAARKNMGIRLAATIRSLDLHTTIDTVVPIPDTSTSMTSALALASSLGKPFSMGLCTDRYISRPSTPAQRQRARRKLTPIRSEIRGKNILLVDDSFIRGSGGRRRSRSVVRMVRKAGAKRVVLGSVAPMVRVGRGYGVGGVEREVAREVGCDEVVFLGVRDLVEVCWRGRGLSPSTSPNPSEGEGKGESESESQSQSQTPIPIPIPIPSPSPTPEAAPDVKLTGIEHGVFSGEYVTDGVEEFINRGMGPTSSQ
ncbi:N-terminal nucleophile aminohydrolase [Aspergillus sclerotiicarbonarius CBS 121057]|uniref:N-terminal nucleophile aminohydrolase n=1 Tax=Aspergillus sclerotiicarbonarius (strain CBS 121057 / IBT 28362) TaxID=1448318 RepID=A0A319EIR5_ASPSB|nr:N-terminal nucleophile aminohydrolase [Aspergillus sclerotiicarbonarius CBS 121057]